MSDQHRQLDALTELRYDDTARTSSCRICLRTVPVERLDEHSHCIARFGCWVAVNDLDEYLDSTSLHER